MVVFQNKSTQLESSGIQDGEDAGLKSVDSVCSGIHFVMKLLIQPF